MLGSAIATAVILKPSNFSLPGALLGGVWALVGWKGVPLIASAHSATEGRGARIREGLKTIRRRRALAVAVALICPALAAGLTALIPHQFLPTAFLLSGIPVLFCVLLFVLSACPKCDHHFFTPNQPISSITRCQHCKISTRMDPAV